jgi:hypothetical protein
MTESQVTLVVGLGILQPLVVKVRVDTIKATARQPRDWTDKRPNGIPINHDGS